jgi:chemotaxis protein methyltransferase CheR
MEITLFNDIIKDRCGLFFDKERLVTLTSAINRRMASLSLQSLEQYFQKILTDQRELDKLINLLTINETYFFRESEQLKVFTDIVVPELLTKKKNIKVLSAGCSQGQEPYSLVISLIEKYGRGFKKFLKPIIGVDIDEPSLDKARQGKYSEESFRDFDATLKTKYFTKTTDGIYEVDSFIKNAVTFETLNLKSPIYPDNLKDFDVIFYRNVSIYFDFETRKEIFLKLSGILNEGGYIFLSSTETFNHDFSIVSLQEINGLFLYHKNINVPIINGRNLSVPIQSIETSKKSKSLRLTSLSNLVENKYLNSSILDKILTLCCNKEYDEALKTIDEINDNHTLFYKKVSAIKISILINRLNLRQARELALFINNMDTLNIEPYLLLGIIARIEHDDLEAIKRFKEALYLMPTNWLAHYYLADIHQSRGERDQAYKEYKIVSNLLEHGSTKDHGLTLFPMSFSIDQLQHLCKHNMNKLEKIS